MIRRRHGPAGDGLPIRSLLVALVCLLSQVAAPSVAHAQQRRGVDQLRIISYYPADAAWTRMWTSYSHRRTVTDLGALRALGANTVRIIVQPSAFGYPAVRTPMRSHLLDVLDVADRYDLSVQLTLFDWWHTYSDVGGSRRWLRSLLHGLAGRSTVALVELQNEIPINSAVALSWARALLPDLSQLLPGVPRTVSVSATAGAAGIVILSTSLPRSMLDVVDVHYYGSPAAAAVPLTVAKSVAAGRPVILGEAGASTAQTSEAAQAQFFRALSLVSRAAGLPPPAPWTLSDFTSRAMPRPMAAAEYHFGLRRTNGTWKEAAYVVKSMFARSRLPASSPP